MTKALKSKVLIMLTALLFVAMAFLGLMQFKTASAEVASEGYTIGQGASVRIVEKSSGIRFRANVKESFVNGLLEEYPGATLNFYGTINAVGAADSAAKTAKVANPVFIDDANADESAEITVSVIYNNLAENLKNAAYSVDLYAKFYVEVVVGGAIVDTIEAPGATDNYSMRSVANRAYQNWTKDDGYEQADLLEYFKVGKNVATPAGYVSDTAKAEIAFDGAKIAEDSTVKVYIAGKRAIATYENGEFVLANAPISGYVNNTTDYLTYFDAEGAAYNVKFRYGKEVTAETMDAICHTYNTAETATYLVLTKDIDMSGVTWSAHVSDNNSRFYGTFDGAGHTIKNLTLNSTGQKGGMFQKLYGKVCNLVMTDVITATGYNIHGVLANEIYAGASVENVYINVADMGPRSGALIGLWDNVAPVKNVVVSVDKASIDANSALVGYRYNAGMLVDNVHVYSANANLPIFKTQPLYSSYTDAENCEEATPGEEYTYTNVKGEFVENVLSADLPKFINEAVINDYAVIITQANAATAIPAATNGYYVLGEDIDLSGITLGTGTLTGVFDGQGHTISNFTATSNFGIWDNVNGATIKNLKVKATLPSQGAVFGRTAGVNGATLDNVYVEITSQDTFRTSLFYAVQGNSTFKDVVVNVTSTTGIAAVFGGQTVNAGVTMTVDGVIALGSSNPSLTLSDHTSKLKGVDGNEAQSGVDYVVYTSVIKLLEDANGLHVNNPVLNNIVDSELIVSISKDNVGELQTATSGWYRLTEDIDMSGVAWAPSATFTGVFDGQGHTISNLTCGNLFNAFAGEIKNVNFTNIAFTGTKGFLSSENVSSEIKVENAIFTFTQFGRDSYSWAGLVGYLTGGVANLKNVYIEAPASSNTKMGMISCHAGTGYVLENVYMAGGSGTIHSTDTDNNANFTYDNATYGKGLVGALGEDYFLLSIKEDLVLNGYELPENIQSALDNQLIKLNITKISKDNISALATATTGYFVLTEDIDFATAFTGTWTPSSFSGVLDGNGYTISNFSGSSFFANCSGATIKNINFVDAAFTSDGFFAPGNGARTATLENSILTFTKFGKDSGSWASLFGGQTSGILTLNNVYIEIPESTNDRLGAITKVAETGSKLTNVYVIGGNGSVHSTSDQNNKTFVRTNEDYAPNFVGEAKIYATSGEMLDALEGNLPDFLKDFFSVGE